MYPFLRIAIEVMMARRAPRLGPFDAHVSHHTCWPWDLDPWRELNNGRTLTLYDLGRFPFSFRIGLDRALLANRWGMAVAGNTVRYRRRVRAFERFTTVTRLLGWDRRFIYMEQAMWRRGECTSHILIRSAVTSPDGIVAPQRLAEALGVASESPPLPGWVLAWIDAEAQRPWPPAVSPG
jgi:acyl-CoA thioesterase FadM